MTINDLVFEMLNGAILAAAALALICIFAILD